MPLLPQSHRGTWLLVAAIWLTACAGLWCALPVVPRGELRLPPDIDLLSVLPGGGRGIVARRVRGGQEDLENFELVELPSGRTLEKLPNCRAPLDSFNLWKGCGFVLLSEGREADEPWRLLNLSDFTLRQLSGDAPHSSGWGSRPSGDGRFAAKPDNGPESEMQIWDMHTNRLHGTLPGFHLPYHFAVGRSLLAVTSFPEPSKISVIELKSLSTVATFCGPENTRAIMACFSDEERFLVVAFAKDDGEKIQFPPFPLLCWDLSTRQVENRVCDLRDQLTAVSRPDNILFVTQHYACYPSLYCAEAERPWCLNPNPETHYELSPDKRVLFERSSEYGSFPGNLLNRVGIAWPSPSETSFIGRFYETASGRPLGVIQAWDGEHENNQFHWTMDLEWSPTGETLAIFQSGSNNTWQIWDIPPRKSLTWFAVGAALVALPIALIVWWRVRRLKAA
jgi:hypothetical protein